tara:strand:- start:1591 stop:2199 length:609 start_codon:yes stop_codon:yes gene_type:complete
MNIGVISFECPPNNDRALSFPNKQKYCDKHGYTFLSYTESLNEYCHPSWSKILYLIKHLRDFDWLVWTDADTYIINSDIKLESFIKNGKEFIIQCDTEGNYTAINAGVIFVKNSQFCYNLLKIWWETHTMEMCRNLNNDEWEQLGLKYLIGQKGEKYQGIIDVILDDKTGFNVIPEFTDENTFIMHARKPHKNIEDVKHLIF